MAGIAVVRVTRRLHPVNEPPPERVFVRLLPAILALLLLLAVVVLGSTVARHVPLEATGAWLEGQGIRAVGIFMLVGVLATAVGLPRQGLAFVAGLVWGVSSGLLVSLLAAIGGCALTSEVSRRWLAQRISERYPSVVDTLTRLVRRDAFGKIVALRLQPFGTNLLTNLCAGLTPMPRRVFLTASLVGYVPQMLVFTLLGAGVRVGSSQQLFVSGVLLVLSLALGIWLYRRHLRAETS